MLAVMELGLVSIFHLNIFKREYFQIFLSFRCHCFPGGLSALGWRVLVSSNVLSENSSPLCYGRFWILRLVGFFFSFLFFSCFKIDFDNHFLLFHVKTAFWSFLYGVGFIYLASEWSKTPSSVETAAAGSNLQAAIAFSFFSAFTWVNTVDLTVITLFDLVSFEGWKCFLCLPTLPPRC